MSEQVKRDSDGLIGLKMLSVGEPPERMERCPHCKQMTIKVKPEKGIRLISPHQNTVWESNTLTAVDWNNSSAVRGKSGIHACWPNSLDELLSYHFDQDHALVELRGFGDTVQGDLGWRAEHAMLKKIWVDLSRFDAIKKAYEAEVGLIDAWLVDFFLARNVSDNCGPRNLVYFFENHIRTIRPSFLRQIYQSYAGPQTKKIRDSAFVQYNKLQEQKVLCELEL